jgi:nucleotidyltransferase substrate binding protein (TIGR01987 family)
MENLNAKLNSMSKALGTLEEGLSLPYSVLVRDACIQRFESSFETCWKTVKEYLREFEGIACNSPKSCLREAFQSGLLDEQGTEIALKMVDSRNLTAHTYIEAVAQSIFEELPQYLRVMKQLLEKMFERKKNSLP